MLFATFLLEREPMRWADLPSALALWAQNAGGVAALGGFLWFIARLAQTRTEKGRIPVALPALIAFGLSWAGFVLVGGIYLLYWLGVEALGDALPSPYGIYTTGDWLLTLSGALALATVVAPVVIAIATRLRWGRIWAMARLSLKEAVRSRVVLIFGAMALIFLFADWFVPYKPEDQVRNYVRVLYWSMTPLFLMTASLLGAFGIPTDVKSQSIHTIVTKPVEKFEVVLGRFLGYAIVVTLGLAGVTAVSMIYVFRGVTEEAKQESYTARVPIYARQFQFIGTEKASGDNVGRVFDIRGYISGPNPQMPNAPRQYAVWHFDELPDDIATRTAPMPVQFTFDIFRLTKGEENRGVFCTLVLAQGGLSTGEIERQLDALKRRREQLRTQAGQAGKAGSDAHTKALETIEQQLLDEFGVYEAAGIEIKDYHTQTVHVPAALLRRVEALAAEASKGAAKGDDGPAPVMQAVASVDRTSGQMLGMHRFDLYLLAGENSFFVNFAKGIVGLWALSMLVLGVAVACSTYLSGVISWLCTVFLVIAGIFVTDIEKLAENRSVGGGPIESAVRLVTRQSIAVPLDDSPGKTVITGFDEVYRFWLRRFLNLVPDVSRYDLHRYVANGFNISWTRVLFLNTLLPLVGFLLPWAILAFYLMKYREIANPM